VYEIPTSVDNEKSTEEKKKEERERLGFGGPLQPTPKSNAGGLLKAFNDAFNVPYKSHLWMDDSSLSVLGHDVRESPKRSTQRTGEHPAIGIPLAELNPRLQAKL